MYFRSFVLLTAILTLSGLVRWLDGGNASRNLATDRSLIHSELVEALDQLVVAEHSFKKIHGYYTHLLGKLPFLAPAFVTDHYAISVDAATQDELRITARTEDKGQATEFISINQDFQIRANFALPPARPEYLKKLALDHLESIKDSGKASPLVDTHYKGYFVFSIQQDAINSTVLARGTQPPVLNLIVESNFDLGAIKQTGNLLTEIILNLPQIGGRTTGELQKNVRLPAGAGLEIEPISNELWK